MRFCMALESKNKARQQTAIRSISNSQAETSPNFRKRLVDISGRHSGDIVQRRAAYKRSTVHLNSKFSLSIDIKRMKVKFFRQK